MHPSRKIVPKRMSLQLEEKILRAKRLRITPASLQYPTGKKFICKKKSRRISISQEPRILALSLSLSSGFCNSDHEIGAQKGRNRAEHFRSGGRGAGVSMARTESRKKEKSRSGKRGLKRRERGAGKTREGESLTLFVDGEGGQDLLRLVHRVRERS